MRGWLVLIGLAVSHAKMITFCSGDITTSWSGNSDNRIVIGRGNSIVLTSNVPSTTFPGSTEYNDNNIRATGYAFTIPENATITSVETSFDLKASSGDIILMTYNVGLAVSPIRNNVGITDVPIPYGYTIVDEIDLTRIPKDAYKTYSKLNYPANLTVTVGSRIVCYIQPNQNNISGQLPFTRFTVSVSYIPT